MVLLVGGWGAVYDGWRAILDSWGMVLSFWSFLSSMAWGFPSGFLAWGFRDREDRVSMAINFSRPLGSTPHTHPWAGGMS